MDESRVSQFKAEIADVRVRRPSPGGERGLLITGVVLMVVGAVIGLVAYLQSQSEDLILDQNELIILALFGVALTVIGAALFLRYSFARFLRYWLIRLIYEVRREPTD